MAVSSPGGATRYISGGVKGAPRRIGQQCRSPLIGFPDEYMRIAGTALLEAARCEANPMRRLGPCLITARSWSLALTDLVKVPMGMVREAGA
jgi:hypothetical protein